MAQAVEEILAATKRAGASDVHITVGIPPKMRVNGKLITMEGGAIAAPDTLEIANSVMNETQRQRFEEKGEVNMSYAIAGEHRGPCDRCLPAAPAADPCAACKCT